jgi:hypothetical protein
MALFSKIGKKVYWNISIVDVLLGFQSCFRRGMHHSACFTRCYVFTFKKSTEIALFFEKTFKKSQVMKQIFSRRMEGNEEKKCYFT